ncbi:MAG: hypothetical protein JSS86_25745 [Cyanobacteria bacterium SZAS LIN-2]|nr:hypothetical protein [Cyanobacteria bacterium SZAS LIN-2]
MQSTEPNTTLQYLCQLVIGLESATGKARSLLDRANKLASDRCGLELPTADAAFESDRQKQLRLKALRGVNDSFNDLLLQCIIAEGELLTATEETVVGTKYVQSAARPHSDEQPTRRVELVLISASVALRVAIRSLQDVQSLTRHLESTNTHGEDLPLAMKRLDECVDDWNKHR